MASVKVIVKASTRFYCAGHCFGPEEQTVVLEDTPERSLASRLAELDAAATQRRTADNVGLYRGGIDPPMAPAMLTYRIVEDPPPVAAPVPAAGGVTNIVSDVVWHDALAVATPDQDPAANPEE